MDEIREEDLTTEESQEKEFDPMSDEALASVEVEEFDDEDISDENLLEGIADDTVVLDAVRQYLNSIGKYRLLSAEEQIELGKRYKNGDMEARETLILHSLRLVVLVAKKMFRFARRLELIDLIQEGNLGLMKAVEKYDPSLNFRFSTYAYRAIHTHIQRAINEKDNIMHTPEWVRVTYHNYKIFRNEYLKKHGEEPPKEVVKEKYKINDDTYRALVNFENNIINSRSTDEQISNDEDSGTLENFLPSEEKGYESLDEEIDKRIYLHRLKENLSPYEYYIAYYRLFSNPIWTLERLGDVFGVTRERIRQIEAKTINKARSILKGAFRKKENLPIKQVMQENFIPPKPEEIAILSELKQKLDDDDYYIFYHVWYKREEYKSIAKRLAISVNHIKERTNYVLKLYPELIADRGVAHELFLSQVGINGASRAYNAISHLEPSFSPHVLANTLAQKMSYSQARHMIGTSYKDKFTDKERKLFDDYFDRSIKHIHPSQLEKTRAKINAKNSHYQDSPYIDNDKLYEIMLANEDRYTNLVINHLKKTFFREQSGYTGETPVGTKLNVAYYLNLFERIYYDLDNYGTYFIPKEDVMRIINSPRYPFTEEEKKIVSLKYGIGEYREHSIKELAEIYQLDYTVIHDKFHNTNDRIIDIFVGRHVMNNYSNPERYAKYINDPRYVMKEETREAARLYFLEGKSYEEIKNTLGIINTTRVSNMLTDLARKMDFWEYGFTDTLIYEPDLVDKVFANYNYSQLEKDIIRLRTDEGLYPDDIKYLLDLNDDEVNIRALMETFNYKYYYVNGKPLTRREDIEYQVKCAICDSIWTEEQRKIAAYIYGIQSEYNLSGNKYTRQEAAKMLGYKEEMFDNRIAQLKRLLWAYKLGMYNAPFAEISREETKEILKDPHVPITDYERELLASIKGLDGKYWTLGELGKKYDMKGRTSIARRINRAILAIKKYQAGEIEKKILYDVDIKPILKYFGEYHRKMINMRYRDNMLAKDMASAMGVSINVMNSYLAKLERKVLYILKYPDAKKFDYDYAREVLYKPDLPFYGNFDIALQYYLRMSGEDGLRPGGVSTIEDEEVASQSANASILYYLLMTAVLKYRDGIRKVEKIDADDLEKFYLENKDNYSVGHQREFERAIANLRKVYPVFGKKAYPVYVINEYMKERGMSTFTFEGMTKDEAKTFIRENPYNLSQYDLEKVRNYFKITNRELMSGKNQVRLLKLIEESVLSDYQRKQRRHQDLVNRAKEVARNYILWDKKIGSPSINANDLVKYLKEMNCEDILITRPILDLLYAHLKARHKGIDILTDEMIYYYVYNFQKYLMQNMKPDQVHEIFKGNITFGDIDKIKGKHTSAWAFFSELLRLRGNLDFLRLDYEKKASAAISPQYQNYKYKEFKNFMMASKVSFINEIPEKNYDIINMGDELRDVEAKKARLKLEVYENNLKDDGAIISYHNKNDDISSIYQDKEYRVVSVREPRESVYAGGHNPYVGDVVIMKKTPKLI